jgi:hypothetical protein
MITKKEADQGRGRREKASSREFTLIGQSPSKSSKAEHRYPEMRK